MSCQAWTWVVPDLLPGSPPWIATPQGFSGDTTPGSPEGVQWLCHVYATCSESIESIPSYYSHSSVNSDVLPCIFPFPHSFCIKIASEIAMCLHALSHDIPWLTSSTPKSFSSSWRHFQTCTISLVWQVPVSFPAFSLLSVSMQCSLFSPFDFVRLFLVYTIYPFAVYVLCISSSCSSLFPTKVLYYLLFVHVCLLFNNLSKPCLPFCIPHSCPI